jgi:hypothetical protein
MKNRFGARIRNLALKALLTLQVAGMLLRHKGGREATHGEWEKLLRLHCMTNGKSTAAVRSVMSGMHPAPAAPPARGSMFGAIDTGVMAEAVEQIRRDGYYVLPGRIPEDVCDAIARGARGYQGWTWYDHDGAHIVDAFDPDHLTAARYVLPEPEIWKIPAYQRIVADPFFVTLSQAYFNSAAILKEIGLLWSPATNTTTPDAIAAQMFHFDYDGAPVWLKFFIYLNDVGPQNGPHVFVKATNQLEHKASRKILSRGYVRISDDEIAQTYGAENIQEITGLKGTVFAVDTMGFHKGKLPVAGHRILAQLEFASPLFAPVQSRPLPLPANAIPDLLAAKAAYPQAFARFPSAT